MTLSGRMMDKATGKALRDKDGKEITAKTTFTPQSSEGSAIVQFVFDASKGYALGTKSKYAAINT